jgi:CubicO group peptidase (beta-lactamase class C family)
MRNFLYIFICIFFGCAVNSQDRLPDERFTGLKAHIDSLLVVYHAAGLSVAVIDNNETVYAEGFGYRDVANKLPVDAQTLFGIGSCTKAFTAAVLGRLQADRKLSFTDKPSKYVDQLSFFSEAMNDSIQIEHLLTHSTGLGSQSSESTAIIFETPNARDLIPRIKYLRPAIGVGKELMYNNLMYTVAGMVGEDITGVPWEENIETMLFHPIGMKRTYADYKSAVNQPNFSYGYAVDSIIPARVLPEVLTTRAPAGSIFSSANDMSLWVQTWMNNGEVKGKQVLPKAYTTNAVSEKMLWPSNPSDTTAIATYYGYGWLNTIDNGYKRVEHSGGVSGYGSNVVFFPDENLGVVVLTNQTASSLASAVTDEIINRLLPKIEKETHEVNHSLVHTILPEDTPTTLNVTLPPSHDLSAFVGVYSHPGFGAVDVTYTGKTLYADFPMTKMRLAHNENNEFFDHYTEQVPLIMWNFMRLNFRPNSNGKVDALLINLDREPVIFKKQ